MDTILTILVENAGGTHAATTALRRRPTRKRHHAAGAARHQPPRGVGSVIARHPAPPERPWRPDAPQRHRVFGF